MSTDRPPIASPDDPTTRPKDSPACAPALSAPLDQPPSVSKVAKATFSIGDEFASFAALEETIALYSSTNFVKLWKRDARTIEGAKKRVSKIAACMSTALKYQSIRYCCMQGGKKFTSKATERHGSTFKKDCPFNIYVAASKDGTHLQVRSVLLEHNHDVSEALYRHLPQQRKLPPELEDKARTMLQMKANKKLVREQLEKASNKVVTLKDLSNIAAKGKHQVSRNDIEATVRMLRNDYNATVHLLVDEKNELRALFFQDDDMKKSFDAYPEIIFIDATYKLLETRMACFLVIIEDGNGESDIVAVGLFAYRGL
ncbi:hypothetical protein HPB50_016235 [Hyalomma asiaticum]|uniref:Uncharacterized protein n=1 Tax=Hyalomma asiaticum TaxID=266040 RepID=A0ACB7TL41_HYAAI|nr:hypothetical protein HPB50_016235 [Hyalomma asiaticum]